MRLRAERHDAPWRAWKGLALVALLALAAACAPPGGSDEPTAGDGGGDDAAAEEGDIVVASAMPLTGPYASDGEEMKQGLELAIEEINADDGLLGRQVVLRTCDVAALEVDTIQACAERLLGEDPHAVITGYDDSGVNTLAFGQGDMPYLHAVTMLAAIEPVMEDPETYGNVFQYDPSDIDYGTDSAERLPGLAEELGVDVENNRTIAVVTTDYSYNAVGAEKFVEDMEAQGFETVVNETTSFGVEEWGPIISRITQAEPAIISFWNLDPSDAARFITQLRRATQDSGLDSLVYMQYTPSIPEFLELAGDSAEGVLWSTVIGVNDSAVPQSDIDDYTERFREAVGNEPQSNYGYVIRDAFDIWVKAVEEAGCAECFDEVIANIRETDHAGFSGRFEFTSPEEGQFAKQGDDLIPTIWSQVQDGENVRILPESVAEGSPEAPPWMP
ncbi:MAG TPA: ABC transporter substrate-binding protein [Egibacteraceae bacterium]|nr:ABC transporter substrate-binding protein [Egibacteraceae bacterium]